MEIRKSAGLVLALGLVLVGGGWAEGSPGERLAMTVHHQYADPGEEGIEWTKEIFVDDLGRLLRVHTAKGGSFGGEPDVMKDLVFHWEGPLAVWNGGTETSLGKGELEVTPGALRLTTGADGVQKMTEYRWTPPFRGEWADGQYRYSWALETGFQAIPIPGEAGKKHLHSPSEWVTRGSRLVTLREGKTWEFLLLNRTPNALEGTYYGNFLEDQGWIPVGKTTLSGRGLWTADEKQRLANAVLLSLEIPGNLWPAMVFEEKYLK